MQYSLILCAESLPEFLGRNPLFLWQCGLIYLVKNIKVTEVKNAVIPAKRDHLPNDIFFVQRETDFFIIFRFFTPSLEKKMVVITVYGWMIFEWWLWWYSPEWLYIVFEGVKVQSNGLSTEMNGTNSNNVGYHIGYCLTTDLKIIFFGLLSLMVRLKPCIWYQLVSIVHISMSWDALASFCNSFVAVSVISVLHQY